MHGEGGKSNLGSSSMGRGGFGWKLCCYLQILSACVSTYLIADGEFNQSSQENLMGIATADIYSTWMALNAFQWLLRSVRASSQMTPCAVAMFFEVLRDVFFRG